MSIGFAAISTTLIINGSTTISENNDDFDVIFTAQVEMEKMFIILLLIQQRKH